jgi:drug/metabolite transporter (DMT)-like permease
VEISKLAQILLSVFGISVGQLLLKMSALQLTNPNAFGFSIAGFRVSFLLLLGFFVLGISTLLWVWVLRELPLSVAYPFMALAFVFVPALSYLFLGETQSLTQVIGAVLICSGLIVGSMQLS